MHNAKAMYDYQNKLVLAGPSHIVCVTEDKKLWSGAVTLEESGQIFLARPKEGQPQNPLGSHAPLPYDSVIKELLGRLKDRILFVGEWDKTLKDLRLLSRAVCIVELCRKKTVRAILAEL